MKRSITKKKVVIITGASSGIGYALAFEYARHSYNLVLGARNIEKLEVAKQAIKNTNNVEIITVKTDVAKSEDCKNLIEKAIEHFGRLDVLVNNAGISMLSLVKEVNINVLEKIMQINFYGTMYCTKYALDHIIKSSGTIIGISSIAGCVGLPSRSAYSASKFAMNGFLESVSVENYDKGIHVMIACPGFTKSEIRKSQLIADGSFLKVSAKDENRMMSAEEVASRIYKGMIRKKKVLVMTLEGRLVVFFKKFFPNFIESQIFKKFKKEKNI